MSKFRKKLVVIDAVKWEGSNQSEMLNLFDAGKERRHKATHITFDGGFLALETLEGTMTAEIGDYVICGVYGELYPCKPDIFAATYEPAEVILKRPTIEELEEILKRDDLRVELNPDGSICAVKTDQPMPSSKTDLHGTDGCKVTLETH